MSAMSAFAYDPSRRAFVRAGVAFGVSLFTVRGLFAEQLMMPTPRLTEGPFYPDKLPLDTDNDLVIIGDSTTPALGEIAHLTGKVTDAKGNPIKDATVEIWQCDANQVYLNSKDSGPKAKQQDKNFQGYGAFTTGADGAYRFRTIKPVPYPGRPAPHIHVRVNKGGRELITTQVMIRGHAGNAKDGIFAGAGDLIDSELVQADFVKVKGSKVGELAAAFDIVLGRTPDDRDLETKPRGRK